MPISGPTSDPGAANAGSAAQLPTGTVTFVMTDIEGSTRLLQALGDQYPQLLADHYRLLREAFGSTGVDVRTKGDALFYVFVERRPRCAQHSRGSAGWRSISGRRIQRCVCGWASTVAKGGCWMGTTSGSTHIARRGSPTPATAGRWCCPTRPVHWPQRPCRQEPRCAISVNTG